MPAQTTYGDRIHPPVSSRVLRARRAVERLRLQSAGATETDLQIWEAENRVVDVETGERQAAVRTARRSARLMDAVLLVVAVLTMSFSLGNIHTFALHHHVQDPIAWFLAPAIDLALVAALVGDAVLSRVELDAGEWAYRLRWYTGGATLVLNGWEAVASLDPAAIVLHVVPPVLLFVLAEAAVPYRMRFAESVRLMAVESAQSADRLPAPTEPVAAPESDERSTRDLQESVYDQEAEQDPQEAAESAPAAIESARPVPDSPAPARRSRRATGPVPQAAKSAARPVRSLDELVAEARELPAEERTAERIRVALRIGAGRAREVRDALAAEVRPVLRAVPDTTA
jgi:hypothetical protein